MADKEGKIKKLPKPITETYKILQELKSIHDTLKEILRELR